MKGLDECSKIVLPIRVLIQNMSPHAMKVWMEYCVIWLYTFFSADLQNFFPKCSLRFSMLCNSVNCIYLP